MCGICGIAQKDDALVEQALLERMNAAIVHRGPDGDGFYYNHGIGLAIRRLAIIDLNTGDQPIPNEDKTVWIIFNGEIYNFPDLRSDLEKRGHRFRTRTDTECIVHLYEEYGVDCLLLLRGMFAIAIWDVKKQALLVARDRLGKKPLYYTVQGNTFYFASELSSLFATLPQKPVVDMQAIDQYLSLQYIPEPLTAYVGIFTLLPAHYLLWKKGDLRIERYWQIEYLPKHTGSEESLAEELRQRVREAVRIRLISDVPLGAHLSGGIDSSVVVAMMAEASSSPIKTFTVGFKEESFSEVSYARDVAQRYGTDHHEFILTYDDIPSILDVLLAHFGEPFADPSALPLYHLSRLTRHYVTVALNGDGGDEAFAGYMRYWLDPWINRYLHLPTLLTHNLVPALANILPDRNDLPMGTSLLNGLKHLGQLALTDQRASTLRWGSYFSPEMKRKLWKEPYRANINLHRAEAYLTEAFDSAPAQSYLDRTLYTDLISYLPGDLLVKADRMTMAHSLEGRSPFLDHELMAWAARLPEKMKVRGRTGKYLLRKAFKDSLPEKVQGRSKQGFGIPISTWLRGELSGWAHGILLGETSPLREWFDPLAMQSLLEEHILGRADHGKRLWTLLVLAVWMNMIRGS